MGGLTGYWGASPLVVYDSPPDVLPQYDDSLGMGCIGHDGELMASQQEWRGA